MEDTESAFAQTTILTNIHTANRHTKTQTKHMEGATRRSLGPQSQHTHYMEDHTWSINRAPPPTLNNSITINNKISNTPKHIANCFAKHSQTLSNTQHTKQTDPLTGQHKTYKDTTLHSPLLRSKRQ